jgi:hypothetical protein
MFLRINTLQLRIYFQIPIKETGEEARLASQDYRAVNTNQTKPSQNGGNHMGQRKEEKTASFPKFTALKKPAPLPPVLRRLVDIFF